MCEIFNCEKKDAPKTFFQQSLDLLASCLFVYTVLNHPNVLTGKQKDEIQGNLEGMKLQT